jgi:hypothetical protein
MIVFNSYQNACISRVLWKLGLEDACREKIGKSATSTHRAPVALMSNPTSDRKTLPQDGEQ